MLRKSTSVIVILACTALFLAMYAAVGGTAFKNPTHNAKYLPAGEAKLDFNAAGNGKSAAAFCTLSKTNLTPSSYWDLYALGSRTVTRFDPSTCGTPTYPFELSSISFPLYNPGGYQWPVQVDVVVFDEAIAGDPCSGPGSELCRFTVTCNETDFSYPSVGTASFPSPCCVNGPFFIGLEYTDPGSGPFPSVLFDNQPAPDSCDNWQYAAGWNEWYDFWTAPTPGYPIFEVSGETESASCAATGGIAINEVRAFDMRGPAGERFNSFVELYNSGSSTFLLSDYSLVAQDGTVLATLPSWSLPPNSYLNVEFGSGTDDADFSDSVGHFYTQGDSVGIFNADVDEVGLYNLGTIVDFVGWSRNGTPSAGGPYTDAIAAGIWTSGESVDVSHLQRFGTIGLCPSGYDTNNPTDWRLYGFTYFTSGIPPYGNPIQRLPHDGFSIGVGDVLYWATINAAVSYQLDIDDDPAFGSPAVSISTTDTAYTVPSMTDGFYYWRVRIDDGSGVIDVYDTWEFYLDAGLKSLIAADSALLGVPQEIQHKDTKMLCITRDFGVAPACERPGCDETDANDNGPWDAPHATTLDHVGFCDHCGNYCGRASIQMVNHYFAANKDLTQDHISYEMNENNVHPGYPEGDLGHERYAWIQPNEMGPAYSWALNGHGTTPHIQALPWGTVTAELSANHPIVFLVGGHWMVIDGFRTVGGTQQIHIVDPWPKDNTGVGDRTGWSNFADYAVIGYYTLAAGNPVGRDEIPEITTDTDGDGIVDFDEGLPGYPVERPRKFQAKFNEVDSDSDEVHDKEEIKNYTFHDQAGYHPGHENDALTFPDIDNDSLRAEHDCDSDNDGDFDGGEDINGDGHNPIPAPGDLCLTETCQFVDTEFCISVHTDHDIYFLGEPVYVVDDHGSRESHTYHENSTYHYELGSTCPAKADGDNIAWNGTISTGAMGHVNKKRVMTCYFPNDYYLYVDVLSDHNYSEPDNWDPWDCWECITDWYHGWHPWYDWPYHNPEYPWPYFESPTICVDMPSPTITTYDVLTPWWWWCYTWPPIVTDHWYGIAIPIEVLELNLLNVNTFPQFVVQDDACLFTSIVDFTPSTAVTTDLQEQFPDPQYMWFGYELPSYQPPDSLMTTTIQLVSSAGKSFKAPLDVPIKIRMGNAEYGWSPTFYDSITIAVGGPSYTCGDADGSSAVDIDDVVYLIAYIFSGGPAPVPLGAGDANCSGGVDIDDVVYLIAYIFTGGPPPCCP